VPTDASIAELSLRIGTARIVASNARATITSPSVRSGMRSWKRASASMDVSSRNAGGRRSRSPFTELFRAFAELAVARCREDG
jgi:hypothetical protein